MLICSGRWSDRSEKNTWFWAVNELDGSYYDVKFKHTKAINFFTFIKHLIFPSYFAVR